MTAAVKSPSKGTVLQLSIASVYTAIAQAMEINAPDAEVQDFDATCLDSGVGMEHKPTGYTEGGKCSASGMFDPQHASHKACTAFLAAPAIALWKIVWSDGATTAWPFSGLLKKFTPKASVADGLKYDLEIQLDGLVTYP